MQHLISSGSLLRLITPCLALEVCVFLNLKIAVIAELANH